METEPEKENKVRSQIECQVDEIWNILGKTWALLILKKLTENEVTRFGEIKKAIPEISNTVLSDRLHQLEEHGLIRKKVYAQVPIRVEYSLTRQAIDLGKVLEGLDRWVVKWRKEKTRKK